MIDEAPSLSRVKLSRRICEELKWRSRNGRLKEVSCRTALLKLHRRGAIRLPEVAPFPAQRKDRSNSARVECPAELKVAGELKEIQPVEVIRIDSSDSD